MEKIASTFPLLLQGKPTVHADPGFSLAAPLTLRGGHQLITFLTLRSLQHNAAFQL